MSPRRATQRAKAAPPLPACLCGTRSTRLLVELAHDLRSPLTAILTLAESLQGGLSGPLTPAQQAQLALIHASALRLCETTSDTLELARGSEGTPEAPHALSIPAILADVRATVLPMATEKELEVAVVVECRPHRLGHERGLRRVLLNLATNALKATQQGQVTLVAREGAGEAVEFAVIDTGPGLRLAAVRALWRPFQPTARGPHAIFSSSGLGLAICRKLVEEMGGALTVKSQVGSGTTFAFDLILPVTE